MRLLAAAALAALTIAAYGLGALHETTCVDQGKVGCSVLPWSGRAPAVTPLDPRTDAAFLQRAVGP